MATSRALKWTGRALGGLLLVALLAAALIFFLSERALGEGSRLPPSHLALPTAAETADAPRQLRLLGCLGCHGPALTGDVMFDDPKVARLWAPNLTRLAARVDDATLDRAIRRGIGHDGRALMIMPSVGYQYLTDGETAAIIAAIRKMPVGGADQPALRLGPLGRLGLAMGKFRTEPDLVAEFAHRPLPHLAAGTELGRRIVTVKCVECHGMDLKGQELDPGVFSTDLAIVGAYDPQQFATLMRTGKPPSGKDLGLMREVASKDFAVMTDAEIASLHAYLSGLARR